MKILVATEKPFASAAVKGIQKTAQEAGHEVVLLEKYTDKAQLLEAVKDVDALIVRSDKVTKEVLDAAQKLQIVVRAGAGYDAIDCDYAKQKGVIVENTPGQNANAVAEMEFGLLVYMVRNNYNGTSGTELKGLRIGILAFGNVGRNVARIAQGFGMEVYAFDPYCPSSAMEAVGVHACESQEALFKACDIVSLHTPATPETVGSIGRDLVALMPEKAILVNTSRKEIIDEKALLGLLEERQDLRFITDIKPDLDEDFRKFGPRYFSTPKKMGAQTAEANINAGIAAARQIVSFFATGDTKFRVNK